MGVVGLAENKANSAPIELELELELELSLAIVKFSNLGVPCDDSNENCPDWSKKGECEKNPNYMLTYCRKSCQVCTGKDIS